MRDVLFLSIPDPWEQWQSQVYEVLGGTALLFATVIWVTDRSPGSFFCFTPSCDVVRLHLQCFKALVCWSAVMLVVLVPIYYTGANYFECGNLWLYSTLGYLWGDLVCEWACAVACCVGVAMAVLSIDGLHSFASKMSFGGQGAEADSEAAKPARLVLLLLGWAMVVCLLGTPSVVYAASLSLPSDNTLGLSSDVIQVFHRGAGIVLFITSAYIVPPLSRAASKWAGVLSCGSQLIMAARLFVTLLAPFITV
jgi:hypothetical protein